MDKQARLIILLGIVEMIILTMIGLYFFRVGQDGMSEKESASAVTGQL